MRRLDRSQLYDLFDPETLETYFPNRYRSKKEQLDDNHRSSKDRSNDTKGNWKYKLILNETLPKKIDSEDGWIIDPSCRSITLTQKLQCTSNTSKDLNIRPENVCEAGKDLAASYLVEDLKRDGKIELKPQ